MKITYEFSSQAEFDTWKRSLMGQSISIALDGSGLSVRSINALSEGGIETLEEANQRTDRELLAIPNLGHFSLKEIRNVCRARFGVPFDEGGK